MGLGIALRAFSAALFDKQTSEKIQRILDGGDNIAIEAKPTVASVPVEPKPVRSDAITLLASLQREARLVDLIQENLTEFTDAQVGAAARPCLQQSAATLARFFDLKPVCDAADGSTVDVGPDASPARYQWAGEGTATSGSLIHHGWQATRVELPKYSGDVADAMIIAPAQVQR
tara:strand:+ start:607001 stop:607522 length:522 start_codon:yes stop_codon:yes gene_type:complete